MSSLPGSRCWCSEAVAADSIHTCGISWVLSSGCKPFGYICSIIIRANPQDESYRSLFVVEVTEPQKRSTTLPAHTASSVALCLDRGLSVHRGKVVAAVTLFHLQGAPSAHSTAQHSNSCCQLALRKGLSKPLSFIPYKPHHIIRLLKICSSSGSEATGLQASPISQAISMELTPGAKSHEPPQLQLDLSFTPLRSAQLLGLSEWPRASSGDCHPSPSTKRTHTFRTHPPGPPLSHSHLPAAAPAYPQISSSIDPPGKRRHLPCGHRALHYIHLLPLEPEVLNVLKNQSQSPASEM